MNELGVADDLFNRLPVAMYRKSVDGRFLMVNARLTALLDYPDPDQLLKIDSTELYLRQDDWQRWQALMEQDGVVERFEVALVRYDGEVLWLEESARACRDEQGEVLYYEGYFSEVRVQERAATSIHRRYRILEALTWIGQAALMAKPFDQILVQGLARLGQALEVDRVFVVENVAGDQATASRMCHGWSAPDLPIKSQALTVEDGAFLPRMPERWADLLRAGEVIAGPVRQLPSGERDSLAGRGVQSLAAVPIFTGESWWGFLGLDACRDERLWPPAELEVLCEAANLIGATIVNARFHESAQERLAQQTALGKASSIISSTLDLKVVLEQVAKEMGQAIGATSAYICRYDTAGDVSTVLAEYISPEATPAEQISDVGVNYHDKDAAFAKALLAGQHLEAHLGDDHLSEEEAKHFQEFDAKSVLYIPLLVFGELLGFAEIWESRHRRAFTQAEIAICQGIAQSAAVAITNARLFAAERRQLQLSRTLQQVGALLTTRLKVEQVFEKILDLLQQVIDFDSASIQLRNEQGQMQLAASRGFADQQIIRQFVDTIGERALGRLSVVRPLVVIADTVNSKEWLDEPDVAPIRSWIGAALIVQDRMIGILNVDSLAPNIFDQQAGETVMAFANQAAVAIENARLYEEVQLRASELDVLNKVALSAAQTADRDVLLWQTTEALASTLFPDHVGFLLCDTEGDQLKPHVSYHGIRPESLETIIPLNDSIAGRAFLSGRPVLLNDVSGDKSYLEVTPTSRSEIAVPLIVRDKVIGVINVESPAPAAFDEADLSFLTTLAGQVATAIERAQLYQAQQSYMAHLAHEVNFRTAQLQAERDRIQAILDNAGEGIFFTDPAGEILYVNQAMTRVVGFTAGEVLRETPLVWQGEPDLSSAFQEMWEAVQAGRGWRGEMAGQSSDGQLLDLHLTIAPFSTVRGSLAGFVGVLSDISRLKEVERLKTQFVTNISHQLKTPLATIETYVALLNRGRPERRDDYLSVISSETRRLSRLINGILELSRLESERALPLTTSVNLADILEMVSKRYSFQLERRQVRLRMEYPAPLPTVLADAEQLANVLANLLNNALNYTSPGDEIVVSAAIDRWQGQPMIRCQVADNGLGIHPEDLPRLFDRFFRGRRALENNVPGTGLGLSISKEIIERHGGHLTAESKLGEGSVFTVWLPVGGN